MSRPNRILIVMSSHADMGTSGKKTGTWLITQSSSGPVAESRG